VDILILGVVSDLIGKYLNDRTKMKERTFEILLMFIEIEAELIKGLKNKRPKIVEVCSDVFRKGLSDFG